MANFDKVIEKTLDSEGGYVFDPQDTGGETYKGISRKNFPKWQGWIVIDALKHQPNFPKNIDLDIVIQEDVKDFYKENFWNPIKGENIYSQIIAESIFDFGVNAGVKTSVKLAQKVVGIIEKDIDGIVGSNTIAMLNSFNEEKFIPLFIIEKIKRYRDICLNNPIQKKFFFGWVSRSLK